MSNPPRYPAALVLRLATIGAAGLASVTNADESASPLGPAEQRGVEIIRQRDDSGRVRVHREVALNEQGDYVNHGVWRAFDPAGELIGQGRYAMGKPVGVWSRWAGVAPELDTPETRGFPRPLLSRAAFRDGKMHGPWEVLAADGRPVSRVEFREGERHGTATLYAADGGIVRQQRYVDDRPNGPLMTVSSDGAGTVLAEFEKGRQRIVRSHRSDAGVLVSRTHWLGPAHQRVEPDDPWRLRFARHEPVGEELRDGLREAWWPNGQQKLRIEYRLGKATGEARWWHQNGQIALAGEYEDGLASGEWSWWRVTGVRSASCRYSAGRPSGEWSLWAADGKRLAQNPALISALRPVAPMVR